MVGALILTCLDTIPNIDFTLDVRVNGQDRLSILDFDVEGIYSTYLNTNDEVTIQVNCVDEVLVEIDVVRRDYTTDYINGDDGIRDVTLTSLSGVTPNAVMSFSAVNDPLDYNFEYRLTISLGNYPQCLISGTATGSTLLPQISTSGLTIYSNGNSFTGSTGGTNRTWYDSRGNFNGKLPSNISYSVYDGGFFNLANGNIIFSGGTSGALVPPISGYSYTFGGWIQIAQSNTNDIMFSAGDTIRCYKMSNNSLNFKAVIGPFDDYIEVTSTTNLNGDSNIWQYVMFQWIPNNSINIFLDGVLVGTNSHGVSNLYSNTISYFTINQNSILNIANYQCYWVPLTEAQILNNYNQLKSYFRR